MIRVEDDGEGFAGEALGGYTRHLGISGMREWVGRLGGSLKIDSVKGAGTSVELTLRRYDGARQAHDRSSPAGPFQAHG